MALGLLCLFLWNLGAQENTRPIDETDLVFSDEETAGEESTKPLNSFGFWDLLKMVIVLAVVVGLIYLLFYFLKRSSGQKFQNTPLIKVLGSRPLNGNRSLHLVEIGNQVFLVGAAENSVNLVAEIDDKESLDEIHLQASSISGAVKKSFPDLLMSMFKGGNSGRSGQSIGLGGGNFFEKQKERLKNLR